MNLTYLQDPGHGWLIVPAALVRSLGVRPSPYSYHDRASDMAYLEEDCDMAPMLEALRASGMQPVVIHHFTNDDAHCRSLPRWRD